MKNFGRYGLLAASIAFSCFLPLNISFAAGVGDMSYYCNSAEAIARKGDIDAAQKLMYKLRLKTRHIREGGAEAADAFATLADLFGEKGRLEDMRNCMKEAIRIREATDGPGSAAVIGLQSRIAKHLLNQRRSSEAFRILENCVRTAQVSGGDQNPALEPVFVQLAGYYATNLNYQKAKEYLTNAVAVCKKKPDYQNNSQLPAYLRDLSLYCYGARDVKSAEEYARESLSLADRNFAKNDERRAADLVNLVIILKDLNKKDEANKLLSLLKGQVTSGSDTQSLSSSYAAGTRLIADRYYSDAEPFIASARNGFLKLNGPEDQLSIKSSCNLAQILAAKKDYGNAEKIISQINFSKTGSTRLSGTPLFQCDHEFGRAWKFLFSKQQYALAMKLGQKHLEFLSAPLSCQSCAHLCMEDCYKELAQTAAKLGDQKNAERYASALASMRGPAPEMK